MFARSRSCLAVLVGLAVALGVAFVVAPRVLAGIGPGGGFAGRRELVHAVRVSFVGYWRSGDRRLSPDLERVVEYWFRYHLAKAAIAAALLVVLVMLAVRVWRTYLGAGGRGQRAALVAGGVVVTLFAVASLAVVMANVQGAVAPLASLMPMLTDGTPGARLTATLAEARQNLAAHSHVPPALDVVTSGFARYHLAMAVIAGIGAVVFIAISVAVWRRFARAGSSGRVRRLLGAYGVLSVLLVLAMIVVATANVGVARHPAPALLAAFQGGW